MNDLYNMMYVFAMFSISSIIFLLIAFFGIDEYLDGFMKASIKNALQKRMEKKQ